ncbi:MAG: GCN5-related N-acetyltransferase [Eubacterium sp.]|nr:GCN5-related N-acetyltransferase [Eubacterium sp.]
MDSLYIKSIDYLKSDTFRNLTTLKYLSLYRDKVNIKLLETSSDWALLASIPAANLSYDTMNYPYAKEALFINGTSANLKHELLSKLPENNYVLRSNGYLDLSRFEPRFDIEAGHSYISYTCSSMDECYSNTGIKGISHLTEEAIAMISKNGYTGNDLRKYFSNGSVWFGYVENGEIKSICFVYQNYQDIWEVAGVHTAEAERNKGYARVVVASALNYLLEKGLIPRYEARVDNIKSRNLAENLKMHQFLRIDHFLLNPISLNPS